ncbi:acyltransferase family protein [Streptomyces thermolineatus]|uniref:Acyltransferase family protein n=1 Tax=Streptomyces thermolineatus TaxID=44033 RepID=A0ABN3KUL3_9ACTN
MTRLLPPHGSGTAGTAGAVSSHRPRPDFPGGGSKKRDAFFDNAKYLAILLVACAHVWQPLTGTSRTMSALYMVVYTFHMPAFIIIAGYFSRSFNGRPHQVRRLITGVLVPYVVFEIAYSLYKRWADDPTHEITLIDPWYLTWFLVALFIWRLTAPVWRLLRWPLPVALFLSALAASSPDIGNDLDLQRVLQFLPFFVLGLSLRPEHFALVRCRSVRILALPVFGTALVVAYWAVPRMNYDWLYHRESAQDLGAPGWTGIVMSLALFGCSVLLSAAFLAWVPGRNLWFTALGSGTIYGFLLHGFLTKGAQFWDLYDISWLHTPLGAITLTVVAAVAVTALCSSPVQRVFRGVMEPELKWAFRKTDEPTPRPQTPSPGTFDGTDVPARKST